MSTELAIFDWAEEADRHLCLIIGGTNSRAEYYGFGKYRDDIIQDVMDGYRTALNYYTHYGIEKNIFVTDLDIEEEIMQNSSESVQNVVHLHFYNSDRFEDERRSLKGDDLDNCLCELESEVWECETNSYSPYFYCNMTYDILKDHHMSYISEEDSNFEQGIIAFLNDAQNALFDELLMVGDDVLTEYEDAYLFVRYPRTTLELGSGR